MQLQCAFKDVCGERDPRVFKVAQCWMDTVCFISWQVNSFKTKVLTINNSAFVQFYRVLCKVWAEWLAKGYFSKIENRSECVCGCGVAFQGGTRQLLDFDLNEAHLKWTCWSSFQLSKQHPLPLNLSVPSELSGLYHDPACVWL